MIRFFKYHGTGNDFILIDNRNLGWSPCADEISEMCHRRFGIGADGLMLLSDTPGFSFHMQYYNSDGKESTMCGNGGRCITAFAHRLGITGKETLFSAIDGPHNAVVTTANPPRYHIRLKMKNIRTGKTFPDGFLLDSGSPHFVTFRTDPENTDVVREGRLLRNEPRFGPGGCNINFVKHIPDGLLVRTYERGVEDETLSCGTGVTASALADAWQKGLTEGIYRITTPGGILEVEFRRDGDLFTDVWLSGEATEVFDGYWKSAKVSKI